MTILWLALAFLAVAGGAALAYAFVRLGRLLGGVDKMVHEVTDEVVPIITKTGVSVDAVNVQLEKVDLMMDSAVDITRSVDTTVRAVSTAVTEPVKKVTGVLAGVGEAASSFRDRVTNDGERTGSQAPRVFDTDTAATAASAGAAGAAAAPPGGTT